WSGRELSPEQLELLTRYADWLRLEAIPAGGLGPREGERVWSRHLADSLLFAGGWRTNPPGELLDVGSGVGLPGIPLAILWPQTLVTLLDRGGRRVRLLYRVVGMLGLANVVIAQGDALSVADEWEGLVVRGALRGPEVVGLTARLLQPGGTGVLGLSRRAQPPERTSDLMGIARGLGLEPELVEVPGEVLDAPAWLLIMRVSA
ncbi:MAG TPA: RsmG family class I SAM-dependent methyltransferase, partial [Acidimicrobiia bacterium]|nr:RsmG family class I SAM-dependent methyltransferase [Acidimicrobiia bacterium]